VIRVSTQNTNTNNNNSNNNKTTRRQTVGLKEFGANQMALRQTTSTKRVRGWNRDTKTKQKDIKLLLAMLQIDK